MYWQVLKDERVPKCLKLEKLGLTQPVAQQGSRDVLALRGIVSIIFHQNVILPHQVVRDVFVVQQFEFWINNSGPGS